MSSALRKQQHIKSLIILSAVLLLNICPENELKAQSLVLDEKIDSLLELMTLKEKIAQLTQEPPRLFELPMTTADIPRLGIPGFKMGDGSHGYKNGGTSFPTSTAMAATWDRNLLFKAGYVMGSEFRSQGRNMMLGTAFDLSINPRTGRSAETAGEDPFLCAELMVPVTRGIQSAHVIATSKHFLMEEKQIIRHTNDQIYTPRWLYEYFGHGYRMAVQNGATMSMMTSYNKVNGLHASANSHLLQNVLRSDWGYPFFLVSDWSGIYEAKPSVMAGTDVCMGNNLYYNQLNGLVASGQVPEDSINRSVRNVLRTKYLSGMIGFSPQPNTSNFLSEYNIGLTREVAQKSIILLKNDNEILPLDKNTAMTIALIGPNVMNENLDCHGANETYPPYRINFWEGMLQKYPNAQFLYEKGSPIAGRDSSGYAKARETARKADIVFYAGGLDVTQEGELIRLTNTDRQRIELPDLQSNLIKQIAEINPNTVVVLQSGGVCAVSQFADKVPALVYSFYGGMEAGNALADIISGDVNPAGRLPVTLPKGTNQLPANDNNMSDKSGFGYRWFDEKALTPQYAFGYGLSYTTFKYEHMRIEQTEKIVGSPVKVYVQVTNTGDTDGEEVVQLYVSHQHSGLWKPKKELKGFERVFVPSGKTAEVEMLLKAEDLYFWNETDSKYDVLPGTYALRAGGASDNLPLLSSFDWLSGEKLPDLITTELFTLPRFPRVGEPVSFYIMLKNQGAAAYQNTKTVKLAIKKSGNKIIETNTTIPELKAGQATFFTIDNSGYVADEAGTFNFSVQIDTDNSVKESIETNNLYSKSIEIYPACAAEEICEEMLLSVNAGESQIIYLPQDTIRLDGSLSHYPADWQVKILWEQISGPANSGIENSQNLISRVGNLAEGDYEFILSISKEESPIKSSDYLHVSVRKSPFVSPITGADEKYTHQKLSVYPNPANSYINLRGVQSGLHKVTITDISGRKVYEQHQHFTEGSDTCIQLPEMADGMYHILIISGDRYYTATLMRL